MADDTYDFLQSWEPHRMCSADVSQAERIRTATTPRMVLDLWREYKTAHETNSDTLKAFVKAASDWGRRCASVAEPLLYEISQQQQLDLDDYTSLAVSTCDVNSRRLVELLLERTAGTKQYVAFYYALLRCTAEILRPVDMILSAKICDLLAQDGVAMYIPQVRMMLHGFGRLAEPPLKAIENLVDRCLQDSPGVPLDPSLLHEILGIFERTRGKYAKQALKILPKLGHENCAKLVSSVYVKPPKYKHDEDKASTTFYIVDPYAFALETVPLPAPLKGKSTKWYILFLYSSVRSMIECNQNFPSGNSFLERKMDAIRSLIQKEPFHVFVFPVDIELQFRSAGRDGIVDDDPNSRYLSFLESFIPQFEDQGQEPPPQDAQMVFITQNVQLKRSIEERILRLGDSCPISVQSSF